MSDHIRLAGLRAFGRHGVYASERERGQEFVVDVELDVDVSRAAASDDVADTVDYGALADRLVEIVAGNPVNLIETLAHRLAKVCLAVAGVKAATITVHKPGAPISHQFDDVSVTIRRGLEGDRS